MRRSETDPNGIRTEILDEGDILFHLFIRHRAAVLLGILDPNNTAKIHRSAVEQECRIILRKGTDAGGDVRFIDE